MDDLIRSAARAARAEVEGSIDVDAGLAAARTGGPADITPDLDRPMRRTGLAWLGAAAAVTLLVVGGVWWLGSDRDDILQTADPATTMKVAPTEPATPATTTPPTTAESPTTTTDKGTAPSTTLVRSGNVCTPATKQAVEAIASAIVAARRAGEIDLPACLEAMYPSLPLAVSCWSCPGLVIANEPIEVSEGGTAVTPSFVFFLVVSFENDDGEIVDQVERWSFDVVIDRDRSDGVDADGLVFDGVTSESPLATRSESLATIDAYLDAIESQDWLAAAGMLDDGAVNPEERADLRQLGLTDYSYESVAEGLARWCAAGCLTERPAAADLVFNGYTHDLVRLDQRVSVAWYEGYLSIWGLPPRVNQASDISGPGEAISIGDAAYVATTTDGVLVSIDGSHWASTLETEPTIGDVRLIGDFVVHQRRAPQGFGDSDEVLVVTDGDVVRWGREGWYVQLLDVGFVAGRPTMLVSIGSQPNPDDADVRLLLVDLATLAETDLGSIGGWEDSASSGVLGADSIVLKMSSAASEWIDVRAPDGSLRFSVDLEDDRGWTVSGSGDTVWAHRMEFEPPDYTTPVLVMEEIDLASDEVRELRFTLVDTTGRPMTTTGCSPSSFDGELFRCGTEGATVAIRLDLAGEVAPTLDEGVAAPGFVTERTRHSPANA